jgi:two-component system, chemotaxis family, chemotaxis protein CheY
MTYQFDKVSILVVEDNPQMAMMVKSILQTFGIGTVIVSRNGEEGFDAFCKHNTDIIIADWMMKPVDGIRFTKAIRREARSPNPFVPIILMTGFSEKARVMEARDAGVTEFLVKPFEAKDLYKRIAQVIERPRQFVRCEKYFGPDRRRKNEETFAGPWQREADLTIKGS